MKRRWMNGVRILISIGALAFLFWKIGLGKTLAVLVQADLRYLLAALVLFVLSLVVRACRWFVLLRSLALDVPFGRLLRLYFVGQLVSLAGTWRQSTGGTCGRRRSRSLSGSYCGRHSSLRARS